MSKLNLDILLTVRLQYGYYIPMLFQTVQGASATESGVRYIAMMVPQIVTLALTGAVVSKWGHYVGNQAVGRKRPG